MDKGLTIVVVGSGIEPTTALAKAIMDNQPQMVDVTYADDLPFILEIEPEPAAWNDFMLFYDEGTPYHPAHGYQGLNCITDYVEYYTIQFHKLIKLCGIIHIFFHRKCFMQLKTFMNIRRR